MKFKIAFRNTLKNWRHSLSALLSLSAAFVSLVLFDGYMMDIKNMYSDNFRHRQMLGDIIIENKDLYSKDGIANPWKYWIDQNDQEDLNRLIKSNEIQAQHVVRNLQFQGIITNGFQSQILTGRAFDIIEGEKVRGPNWSWNVTYGQPLDRYDNRFVAALGQGLAKKMGCDWIKDQNRLTFYGGYDQVEKNFNCTTKDLQISTTTVDGQLNAIDLQLVALLDAGYKDIDDRYISTSIEAAQMLLNTNKITFLSMTILNPQNIKSAVEKLNSIFEKDKKYLIATTWQNHRLGEMFRKTMDFLAIFRNFVLIVIVVVSTLSVLNTMIKFVKERTREIGTMRSIGFLTKDIVHIFFLESIFLSFIGTSIGAFLSLLLTFALNSAKILYKAGLLSEFVAFRIALSPVAYITAAILLAFVGMIATYFATRQVVRSKIIENLNYA